MGKHQGRFKWKKYSRHKGNLQDYWCNPDRLWDRHRKELGGVTRIDHPSKAACGTGWDAGALPATSTGT
jgi:hypothetical protein